jgi:DNA (cytosine-5)-methyltransferase 1
MWQEDASYTLATRQDQTLFAPVGEGTADEMAVTIHDGSRWVVRRLTPVECERLQGFPDNYTDIPYKGKEHPPDTPRYKALGNSMAVPVMRWIGERIQMMQDLMDEMDEGAKKWQ